MASRRWARRSPTFDPRLRNVRIVRSGSGSVDPHPGRGQVVGDGGSELADGDGGGHDPGVGRRRVGDQLRQVLHQSMMAVDTPRRPARPRRRSRRCRPGRHWSRPRRDRPRGPGRSRTAAARVISSCEHAAARHHPKARGARSGRRSWTDRPIHSSVDGPHPGAPAARRFATVTRSRPPVPSWREVMCSSRKIALGCSGTSPVHTR